MKTTKTATKKLAALYTTMRVTLTEEQTKAAMSDLVTTAETAGVTKAQARQWMTVQWG